MAKCEQFALTPYLYWTFGTLVVLVLFFVYSTYLKFGTAPRHRDFFTVDPGTKVLRILVRSNTDGGQPSLKLNEPDKEILEMHHPKVDLEKGPEWLIAEVNNPEAGLWELELSAEKASLLGNSFHYTVVVEP